jgi:hypothetical protein
MDFDISEKVYLSGNCVLELLGWRGLKKPAFFRAEHNHLLYKIDLYGFPERYRFLENHTRLCNGLRFYARIFAANALLLDERYGTRPITARWLMGGAFR